ncbi:MAG: flagellar basal body L-ring protein FlgH [Parvibaculaceae bacterium]|nr:flagellar basal body L-ring protein FlgH [Parvibaculaceae bacterium]
MPLKSNLRSRVLALSALTVALAGCSSLDKLSQVGNAPPLSPIENPQTTPGYRPVSMPMPAAKPVVFQSNSLWRSGSRAFFKDQRASRIGDILTVNINIADKAEVENTSSRSRANSEDAGLDNLLGFEASLGKILPDAVNNATLVGATSNSASQGTGSVDRKEEIELVVAAVVVQILPNGNMVIEGRQEVRVNYEVRELLIAGVVRPEDITAINTIQHTQIAEARISYGGRGHITDVQQPRYGQQVYDILMPF